MIGGITIETTRLDRVIQYYKQKRIFSKQYTEEAELQTQVLDFLDMLHDTKVIRANAVNTAGITDILLCYKGHFVAIELKDDIGIPSAQQAKFINEIIEAGGIAGICRTISDVYNLIKDI